MRIHGCSFGANRTTEYRRWQAAKRRCYNVRDPKYPRYGGRGITMCEQWRQSFVRFLADMGPCPLGMSLDRVNNDGNYEPSNCRWTTAHSQNRNRSTNVWLRFNGEAITLIDFSRFIGRDYTLVRYHLRKGETPEQIAAQLVRANA